MDAGLGGQLGAEQDPAIPGRPSSATGKTSRSAAGKMSRSAPLTRSDAKLPVEGTSGAEGSLGPGRCPQTVESRRQQLLLPRAPAPAGLRPVRLRAAGCGRCTGSSERRQERSPGSREPRGTDPIVVGSSDPCAECGRSGGLHRPPRPFRGTCLSVGQCGAAPAYLDTSSRSPSQKGFGSCYGLEGGQVLMGGLGIFLFGWVCCVVQRLRLLFGFPSIEVALPSRSLTPQKQYFFSIGGKPFTSTPAQR